MFTGIITETGNVVSIKKAKNITILTIKSKEISKTAKVGDSISIDGVCLTVVSMDNDNLSFDISEETIKTTNLGDLSAGSSVNLEPAMGIHDRFGGHIVTGHIDGIGIIKSKRNLGDSMVISIDAQEDLLRYLVRKGSVAVDGISLTVVDVTDSYFSVVIIPHTATVTTLGEKRVGNTVNLEVDIIAKYIEKFVLRSDIRYNKSSDKSLLKALREEGYIQ